MDATLSSSSPLLLLLPSIYPQIPHFHGYKQGAQDKFVPPPGAAQALQFTPSSLPQGQIVPGPPPSKQSEFPPNVPDSLMTTLVKMAKDQEGLRALCFSRYF